MSAPDPARALAVADAAASVLMDQEPDPVARWAAIEAMGGALNAVRRATVAELREAHPGVSMGDLGRMLGLTTARVSQLLKGTDDPAYVCGQLFAAWARAASLTDRVTSDGRCMVEFSKLEAAALRGQPNVPALAVAGLRWLTRLTRTANAGYADAVRERAEELTPLVEGLPRVLSMEQRSAFLLGFHHERHVRRLDARAARREEHATDR